MTQIITRRLNNYRQHTVQTTGADDADAEFLLPLS
jgi:hypothetical protein